MRPTGNAVHAALPATAALLVGLAISSLASAQSGADGRGPLVVEISGTSLAFPRGYVDSWNRPETPVAGASNRAPERLVLLFALPSFEPLGSQMGRDPAVEQRHKAARARGDDVIGLTLGPDRERTNRWRWNAADKRCGGAGRYASMTIADYAPIEAFGLKGHACSSVLDGAKTSTTFFPIRGQSGDGWVICRTKPGRDVPEHPVEFCELVADGRPDKIERSFHLDRDQLRRAATLLDAAEGFIQKHVQRR